jgi:hypothetical protein
MATSPPSPPARPIRPASQPLSPAGGEPPRPSFLVSLQAQNDAAMAALYPSSSSAAAGTSGRAVGGSVTGPAGGFPGAGGASGFVRRSSTGGGRGGNGAATGPPSAALSPCASFSSFAPLDEAAELAVQLQVGRLRGAVAKGLRTRPARARLAVSTGWCRPPRGLAHAPQRRSTTSLRRAAAGPCACLGRCPARPPLTPIRDWQACAPRWCRRTVHMIHLLYFIESFNRPCAVPPGCVGGPRRAAGHAAGDRGPGGAPRRQGERRRAGTGLGRKVCGSQASRSQKASAVLRRLAGAVPGTRAAMPRPPSLRLQNTELAAKLNAYDSTFVRIRRELKDIVSIKSATQVRCLPPGRGGSVVGGSGDATAARRADRCTGRAGRATVHMKGAGGLGLLCPRHVIAVLSVCLCALQLRLEAENEALRAQLAALGVAPSAAAAPMQVAAAASLFPPTRAARAHSPGA